VADSNFIDYVKVFLQSGHGGGGSRHFFRAKGLPKGGPDGGDGGRGGHIILEANPQMWTLIHLKYRKHIKADPGENGNRNLRIGASGEDIVLHVPLGTVVKDAETGELLCELTQAGERRVFLPGGRGGRGNAFFKNSVNQAPEHAQPGEPGREGWFLLELKVLADVGLVGFPNAGKSTLLSAVSAAKPEIADYPFTTLVPNLGVVAHRDYTSFVMADIPGLIEGAAEGRGLGHRFLKHIERNALLLFLVPCDAPDVVEQYHVLLGELERFNPELLTKRRVLAISKTDMLDEELLGQMLADVQPKLPKDLPLTTFSSVTGQGLDRLKDMLWDSLNQSID
jgi:GTP-binding protein